MDNGSTIVRDCVIRYAAYPFRKVKRSWFTTQRTRILLSPDGSRIAIKRESNGEDSFTIISLATGKTEMPLKSPDPARHSAYAVWSHDGKYLAYVLEDDAHENRSLWFQDLSTSKPRHIADLYAGEISELAGLALAYDSKTFAARPRHVEPQRTPDQRAETINC